MCIYVLKTLLLVFLALPTILGQNAADKGDNCGVRPASYYLNRNQQRNTAEEQTELTERENFPWHVSIFRRANKDASFTYECAGTLIPGPEKNFLVLTAASCVTQSLKSTQLDPNFRRNFRVIVGPTSSNYNANNEYAGSQKFAVKRIEINPLYEPVGLKSDAALIQLDGKVILGKYARPVCLPPNNIEQNQVKFGMVGEIAGFNWDIRRNVSEKLWFAKYPVTTGVICEEKLQLKVNEFLEFCTGYQKETTACQGDAGGGVIFQYPQVGGRYFVHGVLSFIGKTPVSDDGYCENYNIFQRVGPLLQWIKEIQDKIGREYAASGAGKPATTPPGPPPHRLFPEYAKVGRDFHNHYRAMHRAPPLKLSEKIQEASQRLAEVLAARNNLEVPKESIYSFNVFVVPGVVPASEAVREATQFWYRSFKDYKREAPTPVAFSQLVWRSTTEIGIGTATDGERTTVVASYYPKGNVYYGNGKYFERAKTFDENVKAILPGYL